METDKTIDSLVKGLTPVQRVKPFGWRLAAWIAACVTVVGLIVFMIGLPRDLGAVMRSARLALDAAIVAVLAVVASSAALRFSVPGEERKIDRILPLGVLVTWIVVTVTQLITAASLRGAAELVPDTHYACAGLVTSLAAVLSVPLTFILRRAAPLDKWWCGGLAGLACGATAMVGIELICVYERPAHLLTWHVIPVVGIMLTAAFLGPKLLSGPKHT